MVADDVLLDCYRLARFYAQSPEVFLTLPLSRVQEHMVQTERLIKAQRRESEG